MNDLNLRYINAKRALFDRVNSKLNEKQREAVYTVDGPVLVLAGAGSGKTTVLVRRIVQIIKYGNAYADTRVPFGLTEEKVASLEAAISLTEPEIKEILPEFISDPCPPWRMLAITFTNKAAAEIKQRLAAELDDDEAAASIWAGTFHSMCMRILRVNAEAVGLKPGFSVYDTDDTKKAIKSAMKSLNIDEKMIPIKSVMNRISRAKEKLKGPQAFIAESDDYRDRQIGKIYEKYADDLISSNALDFDDIIMKTVLLFRNHPAVLDKYATQFRYISVDEFQDTNEAQFALVALLSQKNRNIMVVGDDDQSIYRFRGATVENILGFDKSYSDAKVIKLEQNYRSTQHILDAANSIISNNNGRRGKTLWTDNVSGEKIYVRKLANQDAEARFIVETIARMVSREGKSYRDFAVLYRTNVQSNALQTVFAKSAMPYRVLGGVSFSDRKEIRDIVAYLQLINNHSDRERLLRIINVPARKIGDRTLDCIALLAEEQGTDMFGIIENATKYPILSRSCGALLGFASLINSLTELSENLPLDRFVTEVIERSGYRQMLIDGGEPEKERLENLEEFISGVLEYQNRDENPTLTGFLEENALVADVDKYDENADAVVMMTVHSAKGLEFPIVFLPGMEEGIFPGNQAQFDSDELEEERRLAYVAVTRARRAVYMLYTESRMLYGRTLVCQPSRFISEIPGALKDEQTAHMAPYRSPQTGRVYYSESKPAGDMTVSAKRGQQATPAAREKFVPGDIVEHFSFGRGEVISAKPMGADTLYEIMFDRVGTKKLMATYARLKRSE